MSRPARVAAIVVLFGPGSDTVLSAARAWLGQADLLVCVDNGGGDNVRNAIEAIAVDRVRFVTMGGNAGLGAAHNRGIETARAEGATHVLIGDQDSEPLPGMLDALLHAERQAIDAGRRVAAVGPRYVDDGSGRPSHFVRCGPISFRRVRCGANESWVLADFLISSGSLIRLEAFDEVGPMDESLFIDLVDTDWFLRARHLDRVAVGACNAWMKHRLGERTMLIRFFRTRTLPVHKPFRYYYMIRNSLLVYRRDYAPMTWIVPDFARLVRLVLFFGVIHRARAENLWMMVRGAIDGVRGVTGPQPITRRASARR